MDSQSGNKGLDDLSVIKFKAEQKNVEIEEQNRLLKHYMYQLVFQIFLLVADADGEIDSKEISQFRDFLSDRKHNCSNAYTKRMFHVTIKNFILLLDQYQKKKLKKNIDQVEETMMMIMKSAPSSVVAAICNDLYSLAVSIAEASGGFMGLVSKISKEEASVLEDLKKIFDKAKSEAKDKDKRKKTSKS